MKAVVWHGTEDVRVDEVPDPTIQEPTDATVRITSTAICGQANVKCWVDEIMPFLGDDADPLGTESFATHRLPLEDAPRAYEMFQKKEDGAIKVVLKP